VRTEDAREKWWSRGHATLVEGPGGQWYSVYHGYENGYWTLGRQTLLDPIEWTSDGWFRMTGGDLSRPLPKPDARSVPHGVALSDDFTRDKFGPQWAFYDPGPNERARVLYDRSGALVMTGKGASPSDCSPITCICGDQAYRCEVEIEREGDASAGMLFFYNKRLYCGVGFGAAHQVQHRQGLDRRGAKPAHLGDRIFIRAETNRHIITFHTSADGENWVKFGAQMEVSGYHHNTAFDFLSLRPGLYVSGQGRATFRNFKYQAL
jgi:beta-xylosidase